MNLEILAIVVGAYVFVTGYLGWLGYRKTKSASDYLVAGREIHPVLMALAYGSTFISTSAIIGFGGAAALFGMGLLWLTMLNIFIGIFIAFIFFGKPTRRIGAQLDAHTFPELLGRRFQSRFIQGFSGAIIAILMPLYAAAVMIGGARFLEVQLQLNFSLALFVFAAVVVTYVFFGGLKGVIYTDALQGTIMFVGMIILLVVTYTKVGGLGAHQALTNLISQVPPKMVEQGHRGWTSMPNLGSPLWWKLVSTIILGVGIGVLAQPQLAVRYMTVKSGRELNRALVPGGIFILMMTGVAFVVGALTNLYFFQTSGKISIAMVLDPITKKPNIDKIIPTYVNQAMPEWFGYLFMITLLAAAMSTLSGQFHVIGTSFGRDLYQQAIAKGKHQERTVPLAKLGIFFAFVFTIILAYNLGTSIIAIATSLFFGMCAAVFLPAYVSALYWKNATRKGVIIGMLTGFTVWGLCVLFIHENESSVLFLCKQLFDKPSLFTGTSWAVVDPVVIALPISIMVTWIASLLTQNSLQKEKMFSPGKDNDLNQKQNYIKRENSMNYGTLTLVICTYIFITGFLGWLGYRKTKSAADYLVAGRETHPVLMALAYGSTFISTSAIVGFAGVAAMFGMGLLWLTMLNILLGIFIAFIFFGKPTRRIGAQLDAHTFPELLGRRFNSRFIQGFSGGVIALLMPLYAAAVMIGGARFLEVQLQLDFSIALFIFAIVVVTYVFFGGLKGVIYTDAFQGTIMFLGMLILLFVTYSKVGGWSAHQALTNLASHVPPKMMEQGHQGWTAMPVFGSIFWWQVVSTIILGVGIGVLAQPQLAVRYMTVKSGKELNRALIPGGIFILMMTGVAYIVGSLTNLYFFQREGKIALEMVLDPITHKPNIDKIMPLYVNQAMPDWFGYLFMVTLLAAAMSTLSGLFHTIGTSIGRDIYQQAISKGKHQERTVPIAKLGIFLAFIITMILASQLGTSIIAIATALFFGMCAAVFLPAYLSALYWRGATRKGVIAGMLSGFIMWGLWVLFIHEKESSALYFCQLFFSKPSLFTKTIWAVVDPIVIALPISSLVTIVVSLMGKPVQEKIPNLVKA